MSFRIDISNEFSNYISPIGYELKQLENGEGYELRSVTFREFMEPRLEEFDSYHEFYKVNWDKRKEIVKRMKEISLNHPINVEDALRLSLEGSLLKSVESEIMDIERRKGILEGCNKAQLLDTS